MRKIDNQTLDFYSRIKGESIEEYNNTLKYLQRLSEVGYEDENICIFIKEAIDTYAEIINKYYGAKDPITVNILNNSNMYTRNMVYGSYLSAELRRVVLNNLWIDFEHIIIGDKTNLYSKVSEVRHFLMSNDFSLKSDNSFENYIKFFNKYLSLKNILENIVIKKRKSFFNIYQQKIRNNVLSLSKESTYKRFRDIYDKIAEEYESKITNYINSEEFTKNKDIINKDRLDCIMNSFMIEISTKDKPFAELDNYIKQRLLRLKSITPKNMTINEKELFVKLNSLNDKEEFDSLYTIVYSMFVDHKYNEEAFNNNLKIKKKIGTILRKIFDRYKMRSEYMDKDDLTVASVVNDYMYKLLNQIQLDYTFSFEVNAISKLKFNDFIHDIRLMNESANGNDKISSNNVFIPRLDKKSFHRRFAYPLVELTFNNDSIGVNEITEQGKIDGDPHINYESFIYNYISLDTYIKNATYVEKSFIINGSHKEDSQDFTNSKLLLYYNGILLIETNGKYEVVSHETVTNAGYDIPEADKIKSSDISKINREKKFLLNKIAYSARVYRGEEYDSEGKIMPKEKELNILSIVL